MSIPPFRLTAWMNFLLISLMYRSVHSYRTSTSILEAVRSDNAITTNAYQSFSPH